MTVARTISLLSRFRKSLAIALIVIGVWILAGCIYIPIPEHPIDSKQKDFRPAVQKLAPSPQRTTRTQITSLLGEPQITSKDGLAVLYTYRTKSGLWLEPLCFNAEPDGYRLVVAAFEFDAQGRLTDWDLVDHPTTTGPAGPIVWNYYTPQPWDFVKQTLGRHFGYWPPTTVPTTSETSPAK